MGHSPREPREHGRDVRTYALARGFKAFMAFAGVFVLVVVSMIGWEIATEQQPVLAVVFFIVWIAFAVGGILWGLTRIPTRITLAEDVIRLRAVLRSLDVPVQAVISVKSGWNDPLGNMPVLKYQGGKVTLVSAMDGFHEFLSRLKELNPRIEVRGM
jgi:hypothetical protein